MDTPRPSPRSALAIPRRPRDSRRWRGSHRAGPARALRARCSSPCLGGQGSQTRPAGSPSIATSRTHVSVGSRPSPGSANDRRYSARSSFRRAGTSPMAARDGQSYQRSRQRSADLAAGRSWLNLPGRQDVLISRGGHFRWPDTAPDASILLQAAGTRVAAAARRAAPAGLNCVRARRYVYSLQFSLAMPAPAPSQAGRPWKPPIADAGPDAGSGSQPCLARMRRSTATGAVRWKSLSRTQVGVTTTRTIES